MTDEALYEELMQFYIDNPINVWVPSMKKRGKFRPVTVEEQTKLLNHDGDEVSDPALKLIKGAKLLNKILLDTCLEKDIAEQFNSIDRSVILLQLRCSVNPKIVLTIDEELHEIDLAPLVKGLEEKSKNLKQKTRVNVNNFFVNIEVPPLPVEEFYNDYFIQKYGGSADVDALNVEKIVGETLFIECAKFISNITFDTGKDKKVVDFRTFDNGTTSDNLTFLKKLPSTILDKISPVPSFFSLTTAAAVSSQLVSIPKKVSFSFMLIICLSI